jgi:hypothetical protein
VVGEKEQCKTERVDGAIQWFTCSFMFQFQHAAIAGVQIRRGIKRKVAGSVEMWKSRI